MGAGERGHKRFMHAKNATSRGPMSRPLCGDGVLCLHPGKPLAGQLTDEARQLKFQQQR